MALPQSVSRRVYWIGQRRNRHSVLLRQNRSQASWSRGAVVAGFGTSFRFIWVFAISATFYPRSRSHCKLKSMQKQHINETSHSFPS